MDDNILEMVKRKASDTSRHTKRGLIIQPGAIGDCILTLPLADFMKTGVGLGAVEILGHTEYTGILPGRTCVDRVRSIDAVDLHKLFIDGSEFKIEDGDPLVGFFAEYEWIVTFLGQAGGNFEQNLIFAANCSRSAAVITIPLKPPEAFDGHVADYYIQQFAADSDLDIGAPTIEKTRQPIIADTNDPKMGREILTQAHLGLNRKLLIIHPGSGGKHKCWRLDNFLTLSAQLLTNDYEAAFLLGPAEQERFDKSELARIRNSGECLSDLSLTQVCAVLSCAHAFVGNDSGITHLAAGMGVRTVALFGPTDPAIYAPIGPQVKVIRHKAGGFTEAVSPQMQQDVLNFIAN